jgi:hypothetical protein
MGHQGPRSRLEAAKGMGAVSIEFKPPLKNDRKVIRVWVTKFALTRGIIECDVEDCGRGMVQQIGTDYPTYFHGGDWHLDLGRAERRAHDMKRAKISSLEKQLKKLHELKTFTVHKVLPKETE